MAHFAQIDENNVVLQVIVVADTDAETEEAGAAFCTGLLGGDWKQTSYNSRIRKNYAGIGYTYDTQRDAFIPPKPFTSWLLNEDTCQWEAPVAMPTDGKVYVWDESNLNWGEVPTM